MKTYLLLILFYLINTFIYPLHAAIEVSVTHITTEDGIANNTVRNIYQDSNGFIWLATLNGLSRYDGNSFVNFRPEEEQDKISLADRRVKEISEDKNGFLWIYTNPELFSCYDLRKEQFIDFTGCGEHRQYYSCKYEATNGDIWL